MTSGYWQALTTTRLSRRRAVMATGGAAAAAAFLAACGGGSEDTKAPADAQSSLVSKPVDSSAQAKAGGSIKDFANADIVNFDVLSANNASTTNQVMLFAYARLLKFATAKYPKD